MIQTKISVRESQAEFLKQFKTFGFRDKSSMVRAALECYRKKIQEDQLIASADLYSEIYSDDDDLKELTDAALEGWPE